MTDLIDRQAAIDAIRKSASEFSGFMEMEMYTDDDAVEAINGVPSAEPVRHGKWIYGNDFHWYTASCNRCGYQRRTDIKADRWNQWNYCPNCGAYMKGTEDD